ncbi:unnamed protein product, partial [marine sediment metagenome]
GITESEKRFIIIQVVHYRGQDVAMLDNGLIGTYETGIERMKKENGDGVLSNLVPVVR